MPGIKSSNTMLGEQVMAQSSPRKLPRGKADTYSMVALSDTPAVTPLLLDLSIATCNPSVEDDAVSKTLEATKDHDDSVVTVSTRMSCTCCEVVFSHRTEQKAHFKSDWHRYNLKQQLKGEATITEDQFEAMTGEVSSISGSEDTSTSSTEEETSVKPTAIPARLKRRQVHDSTDTTDSEGEGNSNIMAATRKHPKVFLRNGNGQLISLYRCVLYHKKMSPNTPAELLSLTQQAKNCTRVAVVMLAGGHFSAAVFDRAEAIVHKTFHRYVVRAKRGTVQSVRDSQGSAPKSGGASLRRYNEAALAQEIQELLSSWSQHLQSCQLIFLRTSAYSRHVFFGAKCPIFSKDDVRVRTIPFSTGRPTFNEAKRVHHMLMSVECFGDESLVTSFVPVSPPRHLHPDTDQLVVRPDSTRSQVHGSHKVKDKKAKGENVEVPERQEVINDGEDANERQEVINDGEDANESDVEIELVEAMQEIRTDDLQEFACSVSVPKRNKKRKKKGGQKGQEKETASTQQAEGVMDGEQLSEEDIQMKNKLYTYCKSGDVTQLSQILKQLTPTDCPSQEPSSVDHHQHGGTTDGQHLHHRSPPECQTPHPAVVPQNTDSHHTDHKARTSVTVRDCEAHSDCIEQKNNEPNSSEQTHNTTLADSQKNCPADSCTLSTSIPSADPSVPHSTLSHEASSSQSQACDSDSMLNINDVSSERVLPCDAEGAVPNSKGRLERVVLGKYGEKGYSLLHVAACSGHGSIVTALLEAGCDPSLRDNNGKTPYSAASTKDVRNVFRRFRGLYPDRFDYETAQIPSALTADVEAERKQREAEKRKQQKKAKQERLKDRKAEEAKAAQEQKEKDRFLMLSDREKRALAAERRLLAQTSEQGATVVLKRCFQCGVDISGKVPFEYMEFQFCTPKCLKEHRMKGPR